MLILSRKPGEQVVIGETIIVTVVEVIGGRVRLGIEAPKQVAVLRSELADGAEVTAFRSQWMASEPVQATSAADAGTEGPALRDTPPLPAPTHRRLWKLRKIPR